MSDFRALRRELQQAREEAEHGRLALFVAREKAKRIAAELARLDRARDEANPEHAARRASLKAAQTAAEAEVARLQGQHTEQRATALDRIGAFLPLADPTVRIGELRDEYPFLLLPVRIETRFRQFVEESGTRHELWVRVYPDECAVDTFEPVLSETEVRNARLYWIQMAKALSDAAKKGAWRALAASHGAGRASWILEQYTPVQTTGPSAPQTEQFVVLVVETEGPPRPEMEQYWGKVWQADGNEEAERVAFDDLVVAVEDEAEARRLVESYRLANPSEQPPASSSRATVEVLMATVRFPATGSVPTKADSWTQAARSNVMPDRFVLLGYVDGKETLRELGTLIPSPLIMGPDPSASPGEGLRFEGDELAVDEEMKWVIDFESAVANGMGFQISLNALEFRRGYDQLLVLGLRLSSDDVESKALLESLFEHHRYSRRGFSLLPQGTPTNNTEEAGAGYSHREDAEASFADRKAGEGEFSETGWLDKLDGQWLAELLGIDSGVLKGVAHSRGTDQSEARALNIAMWPATLGYFLDTMMLPMADPDTIHRIRWFFNWFVSGRGLIPAIRIGSQPYGILPTTVFSDMQWLSARDLGAFSGLDHPVGFQPVLRGVHRVLTVLTKQWDEFVQDVSHLRAPPQRDAQQRLLDIIGLHAGSVEYHQELAESYDLLRNIEALQAAWIEQSDENVDQNLATVIKLLQDLGYTGDPPAILEHLFLDTPNLLIPPGPLVDDVPLSETEGIRAYAPAANGGKERNYLQWLADAASHSLDEVRNEAGFLDNQPPAAMLYLLLRHAILLGYWEAAMALLETAGVLTGHALVAARREAVFLRQAEGEAEAQESRWGHLYAKEPRVSGDPEATVADTIVARLGIAFETGYLTAQLEALRRLEEVPTARLERVLAEHLDCCSYRLDAWWWGLVHYQLASMRYQSAAQGGLKQGLYLGAYGWLENVKAETRELTVVPPLDPPLGAVFQDEKDPPLLRDSTNEGYVHAPSLNHAVTAAVLRNGFISKSGPEDYPDLLRVNLSSERVRRALSVIEGIRNDQSLGALLGYQFERGLHDRDGTVEVDQFIYDLRVGFPLVPDQTGEPSPTGEAAESIAVRNVVDGLALVNCVQEKGRDHYLDGLSLHLTDPQKKAIDAEVDRLLDLHDAVADLAIAESVHQVVRGNYARAAATVDAYSKTSFAPEPEVIRTPRSGLTLTHRVALHLKPGGDAGGNPLPAIPMTPRAKAEPAINAWLAGLLPDPNDVACSVVYTEIGKADPEPHVVTQQDLQLHPIDLLYLLRPENLQAMTDLDDRVVRYVVQVQQLPQDHDRPQPDSEIRIRYVDRVDGKIPFFELSALVTSLRSLVLRSRPLKPSDLAPPNESNSEMDNRVVLDDQRLRDAQKCLADLGDDLDTFVTDLEPLVSQAQASHDPAALIAVIDCFAARFADLFCQAAGYGLPQAGYGFAFAWKRRQFSAIFAKVRSLLVRWDDRLTQCTALMGAADAAPEEEQKLSLLRRARALVWALPTPLPSTDVDILMQDVIQRKDAFGQKKCALAKALTDCRTSLRTLLGDLQQTPAVTNFDAAGLDLEDERKEVVRFAGELQTLASDLAKDIERRVAQAEAQLGSAAAGPVEARAAALAQAAHSLLGDEFRIVPEFELPPALGDEFANAWADGVGPLLDYLTNTQQVASPVDTWLYGLARVREKMRHWETATLLVSALRQTELELRPVQLPYQPQDHWLGLTFPDTHTLDGERLLYTAHYAAPFQKTERQCGLLLDEWTEVIPARKRKPEDPGPLAKGETTGVAFHHDRPNSEPPQVMLLVTPRAFTGAWQWDDLVQAVRETLTMAKRRAVEPGQMEKTPYARFLPATVTAVTASPITIMLNLARTLFSVSLEGGWHG